jgi:two-component system response regulator
VTIGVLLLVEDDANDLAVAVRALERAGFGDRLVVARDGAEALALLDPGRTMPALRPRVVFLDLKMPRVDGWEVLATLRRLPDGETIPVVVVSSSGRDEDVRRSYSLGANGFLVKRFDDPRPGAYLADAARYWMELNHAPRGPKERRGTWWTS